MEIGSWKLEVRGWRLEIGDWKLEPRKANIIIGSSLLTVGNISGREDKSGSFTIPVPSPCSPSTSVISVINIKTRQPPISIIQSYLPRLLSPVPRPLFLYPAFRLPPSDIRHLPCVSGAIYNCDPIGNTSCRGRD